MQINAQIMHKTTLKLGGLALAAALIFGACCCAPQQEDSPEAAQDAAQQAQPELQTNPDTLATLMKVPEGVAEVRFVHQPMGIQGGWELGPTDYQVHARLDIPQEEMEALKGTVIKPLGDAKRMRLDGDIASVLYPKRTELTSPAQDGKVSIEVQPLDTSPFESGGTYRVSAAYKTSEGLLVTLFTL